MAPGPRGGPGGKGSLERKRGSERDECSSFCETQKCFSSAFAYVALRSTRCEETYGGLLPKTGWRSISCSCGGCPMRGLGMAPGG